MILSTDAVNPSGLFDPRYTCDFDNSSPELRWSDPPAETRGFVLVAEDPDATSGLFCHWIVHHIPAHIRHLPAGIPPQETLPNGIHQGLNGFGKLGYGGPCPPSGDPPHRYRFRLYAVSENPELPGRPTCDQVLSGLEGRILATAELVGRYQRSLQQKAG